MKKIAKGHLSVSYDDVIEAYGKASERFEEQGCFAINEDLLPYPKELIKQALLQALAHETDPQVRFMLEAGYSNLAAWRDLEVMFMTDSISEDTDLLLEHLKLEDTLERIEYEQDLKREINKDADALQAELSSLLLAQERREVKDDECHEEQGTIEKNKSDQEAMYILVPLLLCLFSILVAFILADK